VVTYWLRTKILNKNIIMIVIPRIQTTLNNIFKMLKTLINTKNQNNFDE